MLEEMGAFLKLCKYRSNNFLSQTDVFRQRDEESCHIQRSFIIGGPGAYPFNRISTYLKRSACVPVLTKIIALGIFL